MSDVAASDAMLGHLPAAIQHWRSTDPVLAELAESTDIDAWTLSSDAFTELATAIVHQQISIAAGRTIWARVADLTGSTPEGFLQAGEERLRAAGLSRQKTTYLLDLSQRVLDGMNLDALSAMPDDHVIRELTKVKGIGVWSAKMHLLFHIGRLDVCPWEDLGVRLGVERYYGVPEKQAAKWIQDEAQPKWSPYCSLAARVLWSARRA